MISQHSNTQYSTYSIPLRLTTVIQVCEEALIQQKQTGRNIMSPENLPEFGISKISSRLAERPAWRRTGEVENVCLRRPYQSRLPGTSIVGIHDPKHPKLVSQLSAGRNSFAQSAG